MEKQHPMPNFTERKFLALPRSRQHKKCAELLREVYETPNQELLEDYIRWTQWMEEEYLIQLDRKQISDRYHWHLQHAGCQWKEHNLLPKISTKDRTSTVSPPLNLSIYLDNIRSAHNVGSIMRTTEAYALGSLILSDSTPGPDQKQVRDAAMGTDQWIKWNRKSIDQLPRPIIAMETSEEAIPLTDYLFPDEFTLALGNEEYGCSDELLQTADTIIEIPLRGRKNSLNVANAFAIVANEITRQRNMR